MKLLKSLVKAVVIAVVIFGAYIAGVMFQVVPQNLAPQELFAAQYSDFKSDVAKRVAADPNSAGAKSLLDAMNNMEAAYKAKAKAATSMPAPAPAPDIPPIVPTPAVPSPAPVPGAPTTEPAPVEPEGSAVDKAKATMQQYQNTIDEQQKTLESL